MPVPPDDERIRTARLVLVPVRAEDAEELAAILADQRLYAFTGGRPGSLDELRGRLGRIAAGRATDPVAQRNWVVRRVDDRQAVGMLQAVFGGGGRAAEVAWLVGVPWQGRGIAAEAARAVVAWLEARGVEEVSAWIRPDHPASEAVAARAGMAATGDTRTTGEHGHIERRWRRTRGRHQASGR